MYASQYTDCMQIQKYKLYTNGVLKGTFRTIQLWGSIQYRKENGRFQSSVPRPHIGSRIAPYNRLPNAPHYHTEDPDSGPIPLKVKVERSSPKPNPLSLHSPLATCLAGRTMWDHPSPIHAIEKGPVAPIALCFGVAKCGKVRRPGGISCSKCQTISSGAKTNKSSHAPSHPGRKQTSLRSLKLPINLLAENKSDSLLGNPGE